MSSSKKTINVFIFRRDLRVENNNALNKLSNLYPSTPILPIFILNPNQLSPSKNKYFGSNSAQFLKECLLDLSFMNYYYHSDDTVVLSKINERHSRSTSVKDGTSNL